MLQESINKFFQKNLISPLTTDKLWSQFLEAYSQEFILIHNKFSEIKNTWNIEFKDKDNLIRLAETFGYTPNLTINNSIESIKKEVESVPYRIREKSTYDGYKFIFKQNNYNGEIFSYISDKYKLVKSVDYISTLNNILNSYKYLPFNGVIPTHNENYVDNNNMMLDYIVEEDGNEKVYYYLDQIINPSYWKLDTSYSKIPTKHIGIEYFPKNWANDYTETVGIGELDINVYEINLSYYENYVPNSLKIIINNQRRIISFTNQDDIEYFTDNNILGDCWYNKSDGKVHIEFNIIPIGFEIAVNYEINYLMDLYHFNYIEKGMMYNKRVPIIPHSGVFLATTISQSRGSDFFYPNNGDYTIPNLKLKARTAFSYDKSSTVTPPSFLDNNTRGSGLTNYELDTVIKWKLDTKSTNNENLINNFKYISYGNKPLPIINNRYNDIFNVPQILFAYNMNGNNYSSTVEDLSLNANTCNIIGNTERIDGIISKSLKFNGDTYLESTKVSTFTNTNNYTIGMWFNPQSTATTTVEILLHSFIDIKYSNQFEEIWINSSVGTHCKKNTDHFICITLTPKNTTQMNLSIYLDGKFIHTTTINLSSTSFYINIGCNSNHNQKFNGLIDNVWTILKTLNADEIKYIYDNKISIISYMGNKLGTYPLSDLEKYNDPTTKNMIIQSYIKSMDITEEKSYLNFDDLNKTYSCTTKFPILNPYFTLSYYTPWIGGNHELKTLHIDNTGNLIDSNNNIINGNVDFESGKCLIYKNQIKSKTQEVIKEIESQDYDVLYLSENNEGVTYSENYNFDNNSPIDIVEADYYSPQDDLDNYTSITEIGKRYDNQSDGFLYRFNDEDSYKIRMDSSASEEPYKTVKSYVVNADVEETPLFSTDNGKNCYLSIGVYSPNNNNFNSQNSSRAYDNQHPLKSYIDMGESSNTMIYSIGTKDNGFDEFSLNVNMTRIVEKYTLNTNEGEITGYKLKNEQTYYTNLTFTTIINGTIGEGVRKPFNPMQTSLRISETEIDFEPITTIKKFENTYTKNYIQNFYYTFTENINVDSVIINYWINNIKYDAKIDAYGKIDGEFISSESNYDFENQRLYIKFGEDYKSSQNILASYSYKEVLDIDTNELITFNYKTNNSILVNEIGLEDENHMLLAYMTFPNVQFNSIFNNISAMFTILRDDD